MSNQEILEKAISLANEGGWRPNRSGQVSDFGLSSCTDGTRNWTEIHKMFHYTEWAFIYNHDFAKALWGEERVESKCHKMPMIHQGLRLNNKPLTKPFIEYNQKVQAEITQSLVCEECKKAKGMNAFLGWQSYLKQMVIAEDPIKFLGNNI